MAIVSTRENTIANRLLKKTELHLEAAKQGDAPLQQRCQCLQVQVEEGKVAARERQKKQDDIRLEAETLRRGLNVQVRKLLKGRSGVVTSTISAGEC